MMISDNRVNSRRVKLSAEIYRKSSRPLPPLVLPMLLAACGGGSGLPTGGTNSKPFLANPDSLSLTLFNSQPLKLIAPTDNDVGDVITIEVLALPIVGVIETAGGRALAVNDKLSLAEFTGLVYRSASSTLGDTGIFQYRATDSANNVSSEIIKFNVVEVSGDVLGKEESDLISTKTSGVRYFGLAGADFFDFTGASNIVISGGNGNDTLNVNTTEITGRIRFDLANIGVQNQDIAELSGIILDSIENLEVKSTNAVEFLGDNRANILTGSVGDDIIDGRGGADTIVGGSGRDILSGNDGDDKVDGRDDNLFVDFLSGGTGRDEIFADDIDIVTYADAPSRIAYSARNTFSAEGEALSDKLFNVTNVIGSDFNDKLEGNTKEPLI
jgi:Ca2+-binding RTX toxin-like protein